MNLEQAQELKRIKFLAEALDSRFSFLGFRFGWDGIIGLIPGLGDFVTTLISLWIIAKSYHLGAGLSVVLRMLFNLLIETLVEALPLVGNLFDFVWKVNNKNVVLLERALHAPQKTKQRSSLLLWFIFFLLLSFLAVATAGTIYVSYHIFVWVKSFVATTL